MDESEKERERFTLLPQRRHFYESTVTIDNSGSTARDHLAVERTYLAWLRTAVTLLGLGLAVAKFSPKTEGFPLGISFCFISMCLLVYAGQRYFGLVDSMNRGKFEISVGSVRALTLLLLIAGVVIVLDIYFNSG